MKPIITDPHEVQEIRNSINEARTMLRSGMDYDGSKLSVERIKSIRRALEHASERIGESICQIITKNMQEDRKKGYTIEEIHIPGYTV